MSPKYNAHVYHHPLEILADTHVKGPLEPEWYDDYPELDEDFDDDYYDDLDDYEPPEYDDGD